MSERMVKVPHPDGTPRDGVDVPIDESVERWTEIKLMDGTLIRVKLSVIQIVKVNGEYDQDGNPLYVVKGNPVVAIVSVPDKPQEKK